MKTLINPSTSELLSALTRPNESDTSLSERVRTIINQVRQRGDEAIVEFNTKFDGYGSFTLEIPRSELAKAVGFVSNDVKEAVATAISNVEKFHAAQKPQNINCETMEGVNCQLVFKPLQRVGLYIPGGSAPLLSTVIMLASPARVAECEELIICTPPNPSVELQYVLCLYNARVFTIGGAQAIAAMAFGTKAVPAVDKIFGPGNRYVTEAKMQVAGMGVPIDMPAGPSEVLVIADGSANPKFVAADLLSQAEHGDDSQVVLIANSERVLKSIQMELSEQLKTLPRSEIASKCLQNSVAIQVDCIEKAIEISNRYAPEHLILSIDNARKYLNSIENAGSVFIGNYTPESVGDYTSGTNHTLPTNGFSRNWSGVSLLSFYKTITFQELTPMGIQNLAKTTVTLARAEGLEAHARAVEFRNYGM